MFKIFLKIFIIKAKKNLQIFHCRFRFLFDYFYFAVE